TLTVPGHSRVRRGERRALTSVTRRTTTAFRALLGALMLVALGSESSRLRAGQGQAGRPLPPALREPITHVQEEAVTIAPGTVRIQNGRYRATFSAAEGVRFVPRATAAAYD